MDETHNGNGEHNGEHNGASTVRSDDFALIESQRTIIATLTEVVRLFQDNEALGDEYLELVIKGLTRVDPYRSEVILDKKEKNEEIIESLLKDINSL